MLDKRRKRRTYLFFLDLSVSSKDPQLPEDGVVRNNDPTPNDLLEGEVNGAAIEEKKNKC